MHPFARRGRAENAGYETRFRDPGGDLYSLSWAPIDVVCPRCAQRAIVTVRSEDGVRGTATLVCAARTCTYARSKEYRKTGWGWPNDPFFGCRLWLRADCGRGRTLWALNREHLALLERYIAADLRERPTGPGGLTLMARLPPWLKDAKNRPRVRAKRG